VCAAGQLGVHRQAGIHRHCGGRVPRGAEGARAGGLAKRCGKQPVQARSATPVLVSHACDSRCCLRRLLHKVPVLRLQRGGAEAGVLGRACRFGGCRAPRLPVQLTRLPHYSVHWASVLAMLGLFAPLGGLHTTRSVDTRAMLRCFGHVAHHSPLLTVTMCEVSR